MQKFSVLKRVPNFMYLQHGNNKIKWFILLVEHPNCVGKVIINELFNLPIILNEPNRGKGESFADSLYYEIFLPEQSKSAVYR